MNEINNYIQVNRKINYISGCIAELGGSTRARQRPRNLPNITLAPIYLRLFVLAPNEK